MTRKSQDEVGSLFMIPRSVSWNQCSLDHCPIIRSASDSPSLCRSRLQVRLVFNTGRLIIISRASFTRVLRTDSCSYCCYPTLVLRDPRIGYVTVSIISVFSRARSAITSIDFSFSSPVAHTHVRLAITSIDYSFSSPEINGLSASRVERPSGGCLASDPSDPNVSVSETSSYC